MIADKIEAFFISILDYLMYTVGEREAFVEIVPAVLHRYDTTGAVQPTDDRSATLIIKDIMVASVTERRNEGNFVEVTFNCNLTPDVLQDIRIHGAGITSSSSMRDDVWVDTTDCANSNHDRDLRAAMAMAAAISTMVHDGEVDGRHFAADALLLYGDCDEVMTRERAV